MGNLLKYRTYLSFAMAAVLIVLVAYLRPIDPYGHTTDQLQADRFWVKKAQNKGKYDVLIIGDSRSYRGLSPTEMAKILPEMKIFNLAFSSGGLNPEIYAATDQLLDEGSHHKIVIVGVTASSLLALTAQNPQYRQEHNRPKSAYFERVYINNHLTKFLPFNHDALLLLLKGKSANETAYTSTYMDDGWVASKKIPEDTTEQLEADRIELEQNKVRPDLVAALLKQTHDWAAKGIIVAAYRPPTTLAMEQLEDKLSGLDMVQFQKDFEAAGGKWITVDRVQYHSYDGSHLTGESALRLSDFIAKQLLEVH